MNHVKCYKLVIRTPDDTLVSLYAGCLPFDWPVEYVVGEPAYPNFTGELFAFDTEASARSHKDILSYHRHAAVELYEALATAPVRSIDTVCSLTAWPDAFHDFWNPNSFCDLTHAAPPGTITTRSITLVKRLA